jgi:hypothetical protein
MDAKTNSAPFRLALCLSFCMTPPAPPLRGRPPAGRTQAFPSVPCSSRAPASLDTPFRMHPHTTSSPAQSFPSLPRANSRSHSSPLLKKYTHRAAYLPNNTSVGRKHNVGGCVSRWLWRDVYGRRRVPRSPGGECECVCGIRGGLWPLDIAGCSPISVAYSQTTAGHSTSTASGDANASKPCRGTGGRGARSGATCICAPSPGPCTWVCEGARWGCFCGRRGCALDDGDRGCGRNW